MGIVGAVEAHDVVILVFDPDPAQEAALAGVLLGGDVQDNATHLAQEFAAHESEVVVLALKILVEDHHLGKAEGQELHGIHTAELAEHALAQPGGGGRGESAIVSAVAHIEAAEEVHVTLWHRSAQLFVVLEILKIGLDQGMQLAHLGNEKVFALDGAVNDLIETGGGCGGGLLGGVAGRELGIGRALGENRSGP